MKPHSYFCECFPPPDIELPPIPEEVEEEEEVEASDEDSNGTGIYENIYFEPLPVYKAQQNGGHGGSGGLGGNGKLSSVFFRRLLTDDEAQSEDGRSSAGGSFTELNPSFGRNGGTPPPLQLLARRGWILASVWEANLAQLRLFREGYTRAEPEDDQVVLDLTHEEFATTVRKVFRWMGVMDFVLNSETNFIVLLVTQKELEDQDRPLDTELFEVKVKQVRFETGLPRPFSDVRGSRLPLHEVVHEDSVTSAIASGSFGKILQQTVEHHDLLIVSGGFKIGRTETGLRCELNSESEIVRFCGKRNKCNSSVSMIERIEPDDCEHCLKFIYKAVKGRVHREVIQRGTMRTEYCCHSPICPAIGPETNPERRLPAPLSRGQDPVRTYEQIFAHKMGIGGVASGCVETGYCTETCQLPPPLKSTLTSQSTSNPTLRNGFISEEDNIKMSAEDRNSETRSVGFRFHGFNFHGFELPEAHLRSLVIWVVVVMMAMFFALIIFLTWHAFHVDTTLSNLNVAMDRSTMFPAGSGIDPEKLVNPEWVNPINPPVLKQGKVMPDVENRDEDDEEFEEGSPNCKIGEGCSSSSSSKGRKKKKQGLEKRAGTPILNIIFFGIDYLNENYSIYYLLKRLGLCGVEDMDLERYKRGQL